MRLIFATALLALAAVAPAQTPARRRTIVGDVRTLPKFHSNILNNDRNVTVYLPPDYAKSPDRHYPVLYMADGQNLFNLETSFLPDQEWRADENTQALINAGLIEPIIIVGIDNAGADRGNEYLPTRSGNMGGHADLYGRMVVEEIKPMIDRQFRTKPGPRDTGLAGSSFGGIVTVYLGTQYPSVFGKLAALSTSVWWDNESILKTVDAMPKKADQRIWLDIGTQESAQAVAQSQRLHDRYVGKGWKDGRDLAFFVDEGAKHNEGAWSSRLGMVLMFLFPRK